MMKKALPIGIDNFKEIREDDWYYVDKTLLIKDFIEYKDKVVLITRPRRFGKTLNMTMLREFFDITKDSKAIFNGLAVMDTQYACLINSRPVIYFSFKDCDGKTADELFAAMRKVISTEYGKYYEILKNNVDENKMCYYDFFLIYDQLLKKTIGMNLLKTSIETLEQALTEYYGQTPIVLIDEYDAPLLSSVEHGYHDDVKIFFSGMYGSALKGQDNLYRATLTGIQRVAKESIFSKLNNVKVYTVLDEKYSAHFGLTTEESAKLLADYGLALDETVKQKYDGYLFGATEMYNPWSLLNYADNGVLRNYWVNTSSNFLVHKYIKESKGLFRDEFDKLIAEGVIKVTPNIECSFMELESRNTLWGLLINTGYLTATEKINYKTMMVRIPNGEVRDEFTNIIAEQANIKSDDLENMFQCLFDNDMEGFLAIYREIVITCTSYFDAAENAYHMLFLGMCISLNGLYKITSNIEAGYGRSDICLASLTAERPHIIIEFKQGEDIESLKEEALRQIIDKQYYAGLKGMILCIGVAHDKKKCALAWESRQI